MNPCTLSLGLGLLSTLSLQSSTPPEGSIVEDVEVMRRILVKEVKEAVTPRPRVKWQYPQQIDQGLYASDLEMGLSYSGALAATAAAASVDHSRGFHVPGSGIFYSLDVVVPAHVVREAKTDEAGEEVRPDDEDVWAETLEAVRDQKPPSGHPLVVNTVVDLTYAVEVTDPRNAHWRLDEKAIEAAVDAVLATLGRHGGRIEDLRPGESITVAMHVTGTRTSDWIDAFQSGARPEGEQAQRIVWGSLWGAGGADPGSLRRRVVVQVPRTAMQSGAGADLAALKAASLVHSY